MKNIKVFTRIIAIALLAAFALFVLSGCGETSGEANPTGSGIEWISPTISISIPGENRASVFEGAPLFDVPNNDFGRENRGRMVAEEPIEGQPLVMAQLTSEELVAAGAVRLTANLAYGGSGSYNVRFRFRVDRFQGHSITQYALGAASGAMILWEDENGDWWNIRRTGLGTEFTAGSNESGVFTIEINSRTASNFASQDFYIIFLEEVPFRTNAQGVVTDYMSGYVITYQAELPDADGHFHNFNILASSSIYIHVPQTN